MDLKITNPYKNEIFTAIFQTVKFLTETINIHFTEDKMYIQTMDSSKISVLEITIPSRWFDFYSCQLDNICIGVNTGILHKILSSRDKTQTIHFEYNAEDGGGDKLLINMEEVAVVADVPVTGVEDVGAVVALPPKPKNVYNRFFEVPLIELESEMMEIPDIEYEAEIALPSANFSVLIHQLKGFGDILNITCNENDIQFISKSTESGSMRVEIKIDELTGFSIIEGENINVSFGLQYLNTICAYSKISKNVELKIRREYPIRIDYIFGEEGEGSIKFFLAPKIGDE